MVALHVTNKYLLRGYKLRNSPYAPLEGLRYDGYYLITQIKAERPPHGFIVSIFIFIFLYFFKKFL